MECVILFRNLTSGRVGFVDDDNGEIFVFPNFDAAVSSVEDVPILKAGYPYQIVELVEL